MPHITKHEEDCLYRPVDCPDLDCNKKIPFIGVLDHIEECFGEDGNQRNECRTRILPEDHFSSMYIPKYFM